MMKKATAVLDFGTSKVLVLLAEESAYQKVTITSAGMGAVRRLHERRRERAL